MTRSFDTIPDETDRSAQPPKPSVPVMSVCPFCGAIAEKNDGPCPRCKMESNAVTRQATRARIGPWYVMQSRNPSAPGMKFNTLLALIRKGQVTPRSVIRGPTTFQLWRFAARVKGISREFGLCYSCGGEVQRTATFCPRCSRSQELPPNPDALLETEPQPVKTVYRQVEPRPAGGVDVAAESQPAVGRPPQPAEPQPLRPTHTPTQIPSAAESMAELAEIPSPGDAPTPLQSQPRQRPQYGVLTPRELAAAFSIQYDPNMDTLGARRRRGRSIGLFAAAVLLLAAAGAASSFYFSPSLRQRFIAWVEDSNAAGATDSSASQSTHQKPLSDATPDWMTTVADNPPPITTPAKPSASGSSVASSDLTLGYPVPPLAKPTPAASGLPAPLPYNDFHAAPGDPQIVAAAEATEKLRASAGGNLDKLALALRRNGLIAQGKHHYIAAQYYFQQVETLPRDHWPSDIDHLLKDVQKHLNPTTAP